MSSHLLRSLVFATLLLVAVSKSLAADVAFHTASAGPDETLDADRHSVNVWDVKQHGFAGSDLLDEIGGNAAVWRIWTGDAASSITQTHTFEGGPLTEGQVVSLDYAHHRNIEAGHRVGLRLLNTNGESEIEFSFPGGGSHFQRKDAGVEFSDTGKGYDPLNVFNVAFTIIGSNKYSAVADGHEWQGRFVKPITSIQVFNGGGGHHGDQFSDNLIIEQAGVSTEGLQLLGKETIARCSGRNDSLNSREIDERVEKLLEQMTLKEKIGQLSQFSDGAATGPDNVQVDQFILARRGAIGSMLNVTGARKTNSLQKQAVEASRLGIPILFGFDIIHGYRTVYPIPLGLSASWNPKLIERCARMAAVEGTAAGIRWTFSPMVDVTRDARWGRVMEGCGEDSYLGQVMAAAWVRGYQGKKLSEPTSMAACAKHFVAYGAAEGGREYDLVDISERTLREVYLPPFKAALDEGVSTFMSGFNTVGSVPTTANRGTLRGVLREEWGFQGFVVSDWNSIGELITHGVALDGSQAALKAFDSGVDMDMQGNLYITELNDLVESGAIEETDIDQAVKRVLRVKFALGLFENPFTEETLGDLVMLNQEHLDVARRAAEESFVLLKNEPVDSSPLLPLDGKSTVALVGPLADSSWDMLGNWSLRGEAEDVVPLRQALSERIGKRLVYAKGCDITGESEEGYGKALEAVAKADVVLMALGESRSMSGEAASRTHLGLPGKQLALLQKVVATGKPVVLILFNGRPLALPWEAEHVPAILEAWLPGVQAGPALVQTLFGEVPPAGKLTASFPRSVGQMPLYYNTLNTGRPAHSRNPGEGHITGYLDERNTALFPFGWGLGYTTFAYSPTRVSTHSISIEEIYNKGTILVEATVKNEGSQAGNEIVQLYIRQRGTSVARPVRELKGFKKVSLAPGESQKVSFLLTKEELAFWNIDMRHAVESGELTVWVAPHANGGTPAKINLESNGDL